MIEVLPVGSPVPWACPRHLIAEQVRGHITRAVIAQCLVHATGCTAANSRGDCRGDRADDYCVQVGAARPSAGN